MPIEKQLLVSVAVILLTAIMVWATFSIRKTLRFRVSLFMIDVSISLIILQGIYLIAAIFLDGKCPLCWLGI